MALKKNVTYKLYISAALLFIFAALAIFVFSGDNFQLIKSVFYKDLSSEEIRDTLSKLGWRGYITTAILSTLQVVCAFLPAEPVQVLSGLTFGLPVGLLCCCVGILLGNTIVFLLYKVFGEKLNKFFEKNLGLDFEKIAKSSKRDLIIFILYILPVIPYGIICLFAASTKMNYKRFVAVTMLGSIPSACIGVALGNMTLSLTWIASLCVFVVLIALIVVLAIKREAIFSKINSFAEVNKKSGKNRVQKPNRFLLSTIYHVLKFYYLLCGIRFKATNKVGAPQTPAIVLCTHGSFIDFIFSASLLRKFSPNFIVARLYFYDNLLGWLVRKLGGFPKSMFAMDTESIKNSLSVLKNNGLLAMMPEARLSTTGRFEDIQSSTYSFIKKSAVPVYTVKFGGDYFADPKWGKGFRRGSLVEAELDVLYTAEEIAALSVEEIQKGIEERLYYNEFEWLEGHPEIKYRLKKMAEGLENILTICPICHKKHTIITKKDKVFCSRCGYLTSLDNRYGFTGNFRFKNLTEWYDWQKEQMEKEIQSNDNFALTSEVELRLPSCGRGLTRHGGNGVCTLNREGLVYKGSKDGEAVELKFPIEKIYRLLFGAGENFEVYNGTEILFFVPQERRSAVDWYITSMIIYDSRKKESALGLKTEG